MNRIWLVLAAPMAALIACGSPNNGTTDANNPNGPSLDRDGGVPDGNPVEAPEDPLAPVLEKGGSRLVPSYYETKAEDGAVMRQFVGFWDKERQEHCFPREVLGKWRCIPRMSSVTKDFYADASCTTAAVVFYHTAASTSCGGYPTTFSKRADYFENGNDVCDKQIASASQRLSPTALYRKESSGACVVGWTSVPAEYAVYAASSATTVDANAFVAFAVSDTTIASKHDSSSYRLKTYAKKFSGQDGSEMLLYTFQYLDGARTEFCSPMRLSDGKMHCVPQASFGQPLRHNATDPFFVDGSCGQAAFAINKPYKQSCLPDERVTTSKYLATPQRSGDACTTYRLFDRPTGRYSSLFWRPSPGSACQSYPDPDGYYPKNYDLVVEGGWREHNPSEFATVGDFGQAKTPYLAKRGVRLEARSIALASPEDSFQARLPYTTWFDTKYGFACEPMVLTDGKTHCAPQWKARVASYTSVFSDAGCTQRVWYADKLPNTSSCKENGEPQRDFVVQQIDVGMCQQTRILRRPPNPITVNQLYTVNSASQCVPFTFDRDRYDVFSGSVPAAVDPSEFLELKTTLVEIAK
jgi:hypothetical protein